MLIHTIKEAVAADIGTVELCVTPSIDDVAWHDIDLPLEVKVSSQCEGDLGKRMACATSRALESEEAVLLIGTDCVEMSADLLRQAVHFLYDHDSLIHCTLDGGYALLGLKQFSPFLFSNVPWSTDAVAAATIARIGQLGWSVYVGKLLHDVDEPHDLKYISEKWRADVVT
jgi:hypothetical protein